MASEYEISLMKLENEIEEQKETIKGLDAAAKGSQTSISTDHTFDAALRSQLTDGETLRNTLKTKNEEILQLKAQLEEVRCQLEAVQAQSKIDQIKLAAAEKSVKSHYETIIEGTRNESEILRKKL